MRIIGGSARGRKLIAPADRSIRPALDRVRESIFSILGEQVEGARVLDLFAGVGAFGLEALSRGSRHATFVDSSFDALQILEKNVEQLGFRRQTNTLCGDALALPELNLVDHPFGVVFMDPPFPMFYEPAQAELVFARVAALLRTGATNELSVIMLRLPSLYTDPLPFPHYESRTYGQSTIALLRRTSLDPGVE